VEPLEHASIIWEWHYATVSRSSNNIEIKRMQEFPSVKLLATRKQICWEREEQLGFKLAHLKTKLSLHGGNRP
jgi:hypothetical protein